MRNSWLAITILLAVSIPVAGTPPYFDPAADPAGIDQPMFTDPWLAPLNRVKEFKSGYKEIWSEALKRPEVTYRRQAAEAIALAHEAGLPGMLELSDQLLDMLRKPDEHRMVRMSVARTLHRLNIKGAEQSLLSDVHGDDVPMLLVADAVLAQWKYKPAAELWIARVQDESAQRVVRISAMKSLGTAQFTEARPILFQIAMDQTADGVLRLDAGRALAKIQSSGLEGDAKKLFEGALDDRVIAATIISTHRGDTAQHLMLTMARDRDPTVAGIALRRLLEIDPLLISPIAPDLIGIVDSNIRRIAAESLVARGSPESVALLGPRLDDVNPSLRRYVRDSLIGLGKQPGLSNSVEKAALAVLHSDQWRGLEQAAIVLGRLDHEPASERLLELLRFDRHEVRIAAIASLRWLAIPENLPAFFERIRESADDWMDKARAISSVTGGPVHAAEMIGRKPLFEHGYELSQLWQTLGVFHYKQAEELAVQFIPKYCGYRAESRAAAVWALGHFRANEPDNPYPATLAERLNDAYPPDPERLLVRRMSANAIGRMKAKSQQESLDRWYDTDASVHVAGACRWAIMQITGKDLPQLPPVRQWLPKLFLEPLPPRPS